MGDIFHQVQPYQESARANRVFGDQYAASGQAEEAQRYYKKALKDLDQIVALLSSELKSSEEQLKNIEDQEAAGIFLQEYRHKLASQLADTHGMMGGMYRRMAEYDQSMLDGAIEMYDMGRQYEIDPSYDVSNSYNLTNSIVMRILKDPLNLERLKQKIQEAILIIERQVEEERKYDWWAWADLGELYLLDSKKDEAFLAYDKLRSTGARVQDYDVIRNILQDLVQALRETYRSIAETISSAIQYLLNRSLSCFISYSHQDEDFVIRLYKDLSSRGVKCWIAPYDLHEGAEILPSITRSVREHDKLILILSKYSLNSETIRNEVKAAQEKEQQQKQQVLFPVCLDDTGKQSWTPTNLYASHVEDFTRWKLQDEYQRALSHLLNDLKAE